MRVPPGLSPQEFDRALQDCRQAVGDAWVFTSDDDLALYRDAYSPIWGQPDELLASAAIAPGSVEEIQAIVKIANSYRIPLYTISTGKDLGYGGSAPIYSESVMLDLKRMNRILEVNEERAFVVVEPGVSYFDLYRHLREKGSRLWIDCPDPGWGSLIGNAVEHGNGYTPAMFRDHFNAHCGMEIVLANGELLRTGMGAMPNSATWQDYRYNFGPYLDGIFSQSNFGIVTKMGFWLMPEPETFRSIVVSVPHYLDLAPILKLANHLEMSAIVQGETPVMSPVMAPGLKGRWGEEPIKPLDPDHAALLNNPATTHADLEKFAKDHGMPFWTINLNCYGPEGVTTAQMAYAAKKAAEIPGATIAPGPAFNFPLSDDEVRKILHKACLGIPSLAIFTGEGVAGERGHLLFSVTLPKTGEAVFAAHKAFGKAFRDMGSTKRGDFFIPFDWISRSLGFATAFPITRDPVKDRKSLDTLHVLTKVAAENGWGEYRAHTAVQDQTMNAYSFNNHILRRFCETIKDAVDPNGILAAGRSGIWPRHLRAQHLQEPKI